MSWETMLVGADISVWQAMEQLNQNATKVLFIHENGKLRAALSDGDVRRWILKRGSLEAPISQVANYRPKYLREWERKMAGEYMQQYGIEAVPVVDEEQRITDVILWRIGGAEAKDRQIDLPVVMMAGGKGTRLYPYTRILPKPLIPVGELPIAEHIIHQFRRYGCKDFYLVVNHKKNMIKAYFNEIEKDYQIHYADEETPLGTGGGLSLLKGKISSTFILTNCDILIREDFSKIYRLHKEKKNLITMVCSLKNFRIPYGVVEIGEDGGIDSMSEKPVFSFFTNTGCYIAEPRVIEELEENREIGFPDVIAHYKAMGENIGIYPIAEHAWLDMGEMDELEKMRKRLDKEEAGL